MKSDFQQLAPHCEPVVSPRVFLEKLKQIESRVAPLNRANEVSIPLVECPTTSSGVGLPAATYDVDTALLNARLRECDQRLTEVRNEYLLTLSAINSHHQYYYTAELPAIMRIETCQSTHSDFSEIREDSTKVTRERNIIIFLQESLAFTRTAAFTSRLPLKTSEWSFVCEIIPASSLLLFLKVLILKQQSSSAEGESCLDKEACKWSSKAAKDYKIITHGERALQMLERRFKMLSGDTTVSVEQKIVEVKESVRKAQVSQVKAESRLASSAMTQADEELERDRRLSEAHMSNGDISEDEFEFTDFDDYDKDGDTFIDSTSCSMLCGYPLACRVLYSYQACQGDELSITEGEELQVIEDGDMEDWLKLDWSFNSSGSSSEHSKNVGVLCDTGLAWALYEYHDQGAEELTFPEGALISLLRCRQGEVDDGFWEGELDGHVGVFPSLVVELLRYPRDLSLLTPTLPPFSPPIPISGTLCGLLCSSPGPGSWSVNSTPPRDLEDRLQGAVPLEIQRLSDSRAGGDSHSQ
ncbi:unnamed protein product [Coregonus sp. 'balchen']|nr:unnamed protein product [Coregonus sp. 'balchen']